MFKRILAVSLAGLLAATGAGCSKSVTGTAAKAAVAANPDGVDIANLDTGNYPTGPRPAYGAANDDVFGATLEAHRMAANVVLPSDVDPTLVHLTPVVTTTLFAAEKLAVILPKPAPDIAAAHHMVTGFATARHSDGDTISLINMVLRFPDAAEAAAAATELSTQAAPDGGGPLAIPRYPDALGTTYDQPRLNNSPLHAVHSYLPHGPYLLYQWAASPDDPQIAAELIAATLDRQAPLIDGFAATDVAKFRDLPKDPLGFLNRVVPADSNAVRPSDHGDFDPQAALHFQEDPIGATVDFRDTGVDGVARMRTQVYRTRDVAAAELLLKLSTTKVGARHGATVAPGVPGLPMTRCFEFPKAGKYEMRFGCYGRADRYVFEAWDQQERNVHQQMASQYLMLTGRG